MFLMFRKFLGLTAISVSLSAFGQGYPAKSITVVIPSTAGGVVDMLARTMQGGMSTVLKQPLIIENKPGAGGNIAASYVAKITPDGYTVLCSAGSVLVSGVAQNLNFSPMTDLIPVARVTVGGFVLVVAKNSPFRTVADLVNYGKANPGKLFFASSGAGNSTHIGAEMLNSMAGMKATHVPYKGSGAALTDLIGGRVDFMIDSRVSITELLRSGALRALAVTDSTRAKDMPNLPAIGELLPGYQITGWIGYFVPKETKPDVVAKLTNAVKITLTDPAVMKSLRDNSGEIAYLDPNATLDFMREDNARLQKVIREANIKFE